MNSLNIQALIYYNRGPIDLTIEAGQCIGLSGPSGSGKTLMLRAIADLDDYSGHIYLDGVECRATPAPQWRRRVGLLPAESQWWCDTVGEHFPFHPDTTYLKELGFDMDVLSWRISRLSSGERQRLALARLLSKRPQALLLDEPTASLDQDNISHAENVIAEYRRGTQSAVLWVSHDMDQIARMAHRHFRIDGQAITELSI